jgi:Holliday junction resolvase RusA-like endonuclease
MIVVELAGTPVGKGRPRFMRATGHAYTPEKTRNFETNLLLRAQDVMAGQPPIEGPVAVIVYAYFPIPQSWSQKKRAGALLGVRRPTGRPDLDNIIKMLDAFNGIVWRDDAQIVEGSVSKHYSDRPRLCVEVKPVQSVYS